MVEKIVQKYTTTCHKCSTKMSFTEDDILYSYLTYSCEYYDTNEIHGRVRCPTCENTQYIGVLVPDTRLTRDEFSSLYKGRIYN